MKIYTLLLAMLVGCSADREGLDLQGTNYTIDAQDASVPDTRIELDASPPMLDTKTPEAEPVLKCGTMYSEKKYNGSIYRSFSAITLWNEAEVCCEKLGGHLATISGPVENMIAGDRVPEWNKAIQRGPWIGLLREKNHYRWVTDEPVPYINFTPDEQNRDACVGYYPETGFTWAGVECDHFQMASYVCEINN